MQGLCLDGYVFESDRRRPSTVIRGRQLLGVLQVVDVAELVDRRVRLNREPKRSRSCVALAPKSKRHRPTPAPARQSVSDLTAAPEGTKNIAFGAHKVPQRLTAATSVLALVQVFCPSARGPLS